MLWLNLHIPTRAGLPTLAQADLPLTTLLPMVGILLIILGSFMMLNKRKRRQGKRLSAREQLERSKQEHQTRGDLEQLMVELEQLTKRFSSQLDAKSMQLERLIDQADRRIEELRRLQGEDTSAPIDDGAADVSRASDTSSWPSDPGIDATATAAAPQAEAAAAQRTPPAQPTDELTENVYRLADQGLDAAGIAHQLDEHIGKIELMLALRKA